MPAKKKAKVAPRPKRPRPRRSLTREDFVAAIEQRMAQIERLLYAWRDQVSNTVHDMREANRAGNASADAQVSAHLNAFNQRLDRVEERLDNLLTQLVDRLTAGDFDHDGETRELPPVDPKLENPSF